MAILKFSAPLSPAAVSGTAQCSEQAFTVGPGGYDALNSAVIVSKPTLQTVMPCMARVSSATQIAITFVNPTAGSVTPTAGEVYQFTVIT